MAASRFLEGALPLTSLLTGHVRAAVMSGISGSGKSSAAALFAMGRLEHFAFVAWLDARSEDALRTQMPAALAWLGATPPAGGSTAQLWTDLLAELPVPWLVVLDGAEDPDVVRDWIPTSGYGHVIVTTRHGQWPSSTAPTLELGKMDSGEAEALLRARLADPSDPSSIDTESCQLLIERLAGWPLALEYAASWLRLHGRGADDLHVLFERLDRLDLDDPQLGPHAYPATATGVIRDVCDSLPPAAQLLLSGIGGMRGRGPVRVLSEWLDVCGEDAPDAVRHLAAASVARRLIIDDRRGPHEFDEVLQAHDAVVLVRSGTGFPMRVDHFWRLVEALTATLGQLVAEGRFVEAATLVLPADGVACALLTDGVPDRMRVMGTALMHNLGVTATMVGLTALAERWLTCATNIRDRFAYEDIRDRPETAVLQLQTLGALGQVVAQNADQAKLRVIADRSVDLLRLHPGIGSQGTPSASEALVPLTRALQQHDPACASLPMLIYVTAGVTLTPVGTGGQLVARLQSEIESARRLARAERWTESVDTVLAAANDADARGVLVGVMAEELFSIALELAVSLLRRPHLTPPAIVSGLGRLAEWLAAVEDATSCQSLRLDLLRSIRTLDPGTIEEAMRVAATQPEASTTLVAEWLSVADSVLSMLRSQWLSRSLPLDDLPPGMSVLRTIDGGGDSIYWLGVHQEMGIPIVVFCTTSVIEYAANGACDPLESSLRAAGLAGGVNQDRPPPLADGWTITIEGGVVIVRDAARVEWLTTEDTQPDTFLEAMATSAFAYVIYADLGNVALADLPPDRPAGLVRVVPPPARPPLRRGSPWDLLRSWIDGRR